MRDFNSDTHIEEWVSENGGIEGLRHALARGVFAGQNKTLVSAWLQAHDRKQEELNANADRALLERSVAASECSAASAERSAKWAMWAVVIALLAVIVAVFQKH